LAPSTNKKNLALFFVDSLTMQPDPRNLNRADERELIATVQVHTCHINLSNYCSSWLAVRVGCGGVHKNASKKGGCAFPKKKDPRKAKTKLAHCFLVVGPSYLTHSLLAAFETRTPQPSRSLQSIDQTNKQSIG